MITDNVVINSNYSWIDVEQPHIVDFEFLKNEYLLSPLLVQDCLKPDHLPKYELAEHGHFLMTRVYDVRAGSEDITVQALTHKIALFITDERLITIHSGGMEFLSEFIDHRDKVGFPAKLTNLVYQLLKAIIIHYQAPITKLQLQYEDFEDEILSKRESLSNKRVYLFRRKIFVFKSILKQTNSALLISKEFWEEENSLLQDLKENLQQLYFQLEDISNSFDQLYAVYLSILNQKANEVMKILTVFASILLPLTFIASFYGMNFDYLPGIHSRVGLEVVNLSMIFLTCMAIWYFKRKGWFMASKD